MQQYIFQIYALYAAANGLIMLVLGMLVTRARVKTRTDIGDGGVPEMAGPLRAHANNTEYVPMALILMWLVLPLGGSVWLIHGAGIPLTLGRLIHGYALSRNTGPSTGRFIGMVLTWIAYVVAIAGVVYLAVTGMTATAG